MEEMRKNALNPLSRAYTLSGLVRFALPSMVMMVFLSVYTIVDGIFISNFVGTLALGAVNIIFPLISLEMGLGIMLATGSNAIIARRLGEGDAALARQNFSLVVLVAVVCGLMVEGLALLFLPQIIDLLGASAAQYPYCRDYPRAMLLFAPALFLQVGFQSYFVTAGRPKLGLLVMVGAGLVNIGLDYLLIPRLGVAGAGLATGLGYMVPAMAGLCFFARPRGGDLYLVRPSLERGLLWRACLNGSSEMVSNMANAVSTFLFNIMFMRCYGEDGVAAITMALYFQFVFAAVYFGYSGGVAPIISYKFGNGDTAGLRQVVRDSFRFILGISLLNFTVAILVSAPALLLFAGGNREVASIAQEGFPLFAVSFLFAGVGIFASNMFTALSDGVTSALISFMRTLLFLALAILLLPLVFKEAGLWAAISVAEGMGALVALVCLVLRRPQYQY